MTRFLVELFLFVLLQAAVFGTLIGVWYEPDENGYNAASIDKHELLKAQPSPRMIFVGGSNLAFGLDSKMIAEQLPYHPVNMGLFAGFSYGYMLREIEDDVREGDVVVVMLEYPHFDPSAAQFLSARDLVLLLEARPENLRYYRFPEIKKVLDEGISLYAGAVLRRAWGNLRGVESDFPGIYIRNIFNELGDAVGHWEVETDHVQSEVWLGEPHEETLTKVVEDLNAFIERCEKRGVFVVYACPPIPRNSFAAVLGGAAGYAVVRADFNVDSWLNQFHHLLSERLKAPVITTPEHLLFPVEDFYDSDYHLTQQGTRRKTQLLIDALRAALGLTEPAPPPP